MKLYRKIIKTIQNPIILFNNLELMIIHCLSCGKCISSHGYKCPYCTAEISELTLERNGINIEKPKITRRFKDLIRGLVTK